MEEYDQAIDLSEPEWTRYTALKVEVERVKKEYSPIVQRALPSYDSPKVTPSESTLRKSAIPIGCKCCTPGMATVWPESKLFFIPNIKCEDLTAMKWTRRSIFWFSPIKKRSDNIRRHLSWFWLCKISKSGNLEIWKSGNLEIWKSLNLLVSEWVFGYLMEFLFPFDQHHHMMRIRWLVANTTFSFCKDISIRDQVPQQSL
jgi:hypothetical protein